MPTYRTGINLFFLNRLTSFPSQPDKSDSNFCQKTAAGMLLLKLYSHSRMSP